jgi:hypothetical protein
LKGFQQHYSERAGQSPGWEGGLAPALRDVG